MKQQKASEILWVPDVPIHYQVFIFEKILPKVSSYKLLDTITQYKSISTLK